MTPEESMIQLYTDKIDTIMNGYNLRSSEISKTYYITALVRLQEINWNSFQNYLYDETTYKTIRNKIFDPIKEIVGE